MSEYGCVCVYIRVLRVCVYGYYIVNSQTFILILMLIRIHMHIPGYISRLLPLRTHTSHKLISQNLQSNTSRYEVTITAEIVPLNRGDLIITSKMLTGMVYEYGIL
ncbi:hypothetical protein EON63_14135 [archaeon]|nr:MAG: hypothetical protein EON63_14135 [archaeon]